MKKSLPILIMAFIFSNACIASDLNEKLTQLDKYSLEILGISIRAVSELIQLETHPMFTSLDYIQENGTYQYLQELQEKGYIKMEHVKGMPNGERMDEDFVWLVQTELGQYFEQCFKGEQHNNALNLDAAQKTRSAH